MPVWSFEILQIYGCIKEKRFGTVNKDSHVSLAKNICIQKGETERSPLYEHKVTILIFLDADNQILKRR